MKQQNRPIKSAFGFKRNVQDQTRRAPNKPAIKNSVRSETGRPQRPSLSNQVQNRTLPERQIPNRQVQNKQIQNRQVQNRELPNHPVQQNLSSQIQPNPSTSKSQNRATTFFVSLGIALLVTIIATPLAMSQLESIFQSYGGLPIGQSAMEGPDGNTWPTPPPTYVAPMVVQATTARAVPTPTPLPPPTWEEMNYLTSIKFTTSSVVDVNRTTPIAFLGDVLTDRLLLKAVGEVQVGIDLNKVSEMSIEGKRIRFDVPKPEITSIELLPDQTQIYSSIQVIFLSQYPGLEQEALEQAKSQLRAEIAENDSMMKLAEEMTKLNLTEFLRNAGFETIDIDFIDPQLTEGMARPS